MAHKMIYNVEFPDGKEVELTAEEETAREERAIVVAKEIEDHNAGIEKQQTDKAMKSGKELIYQGRLANSSWSGRSDFLIKTSNKTNLGNYGYEVTDTKISSNPTPYHLVQISSYSDLLSKFQGRMPDKMHLILKHYFQY